MNYHLRNFCDTHHLSSQEKAIMPDLIVGRTMMDISHRHSMIPATAKRHTACIYAKCNASSGRAELLDYMQTLLPTHLLSIQLEIRLNQLRERVNEYFDSDCADVLSAENALIAEAGRH